MKNETIKRISDGDVYDVVTGEVLPVPKHIPIERAKVLKDRLSASDKAIGEALVSHGGLISRVAKTLGYSTSFIKKRIEKSEYLLDLVDLIEHEMYDLAKSGLRTHLENESMDAIKTFLKYKGHKFGFGTEREVRDAPMNINITITDAEPKEVKIHDVTGEVIDDEYTDTVTTLPKTSIRK